MFPAGRPRIVRQPVITAEIDDRFSDIHDRMDALEAFMQELEDSLANIEPEEVNEQRQAA